MRNTLAIAEKEIKAYFTSPMAYIIALVFVVLTGIFFVGSIAGVAFPDTSIRGFILPSQFILTILAPLFTMRLLAEEQKLGTLELLLTAPIRDWEVVVGKYLASLAFFAGTVTLTLYYVILLFWFGSPDPGPIFSGYLGVLLYGAAALSVGLLTSSLTNNQIVAAVVGFGILLVLTFIDQAAGPLTGPITTFLNYLSLATHFEDFTRGVIDTSSLAYFASVILTFLFFTVRSLESRRWR